MYLQRAQNRNGGGFLKLVVASEHNDDNDVEEILIVSEGTRTYLDFGSSYYVRSRRHGFDSFEIKIKSCSLVDRCFNL